MRCEVYGAAIAAQVHALQQTSDFHADVAHRMRLGDVQPNMTRGTLLAPLPRTGELPTQSERARRVREFVRNSCFWSAPVTYFAVSDDIAVLGAVSLSRQLCVLTLAQIAKQKDTYNQQQPPSLDRRDVSGASRRCKRWSLVLSRPRLRWERRRFHRDSARQ